MVSVSLITEDSVCTEGVGDKGVSGEGVLRVCV